MHEYTDFSPLRKLLSSFLTEAQRHGCQWIVRFLLSNQYFTATRTKCERLYVFLRALLKGGRKSGFETGVEN